jgi:hypothetical protein
MKLHILNDLNIEFEDFVPQATGADVVVLVRAAPQGGDLPLTFRGSRA